MPTIDALFDWLVDGAPGASSSAQVLARFCDDTVAAGVPLSRAQAFVRTLHPQIMGRRFLWKPGHAVEVHEAPYALLRSPEFQRSPLAQVFAAGQPYRRKGDFAAVPGLEELVAEGVTDYVIEPLRFHDGTHHAISFSTQAPGGFTDAQVAALHKLCRPLARMAEVLALTRTAANVLSTYVGRNAGEQILSGKIQRGDTQSIEAAIWFSDLRGFTEISGQLEPHEVIRMLNDLFDCQVPAIEGQGGEVLKFIGDGLLAIFPLERADRAPEHVCQAALDAAVGAFAALDTLNAERAARGVAAIRFGLALHVGRVAYGNIGGSARLDFTCIGAAVNLASRLEGLTGKLGRRVVLSSDFVQRAGLSAASLGRFALKGVAREQEAFAPPQPALQ